MSGKQGDPAHQARMRSSGCSDEEFVADLGLFYPSQQAEVALAIRSTIAQLAEMPEESLCAHHTFAEHVGGRGFFDDSLDTVEFLMTLEDHLGTRIPTAIAEGITGVNELDFPHPLYTVADLVIPMTKYLIEMGIMAIG